MHYIVFDLEWNIPVRNSPADATTRAALPFEIIEIGAVRLNGDFEITDEFSTYVRPKVYPVLNSHIAAVTRRFQQSLKFGLPFPQAAAEFSRWCAAGGEEYAFGIWSESDPSVLKANLAFHGLDSHLPLQCLDVQHVFDDLVEQSGQQRSIEYAVDFLRLPKTWPFHQAVRDACYTGSILRETARIAACEYGLTDLLGVYAYDPNLNRSTRLSLEPLPSQAQVRARLMRETWNCPACAAELKRLGDWTFQGNRADARFACVEHGPVAGKARLRTKDAHVLTDLVLRLEKGRQADACQDDA
jgi:inhibitor of KinA sporulation pathway (predicted exonuclease)